MRKPWTVCAALLALLLALAAAPACALDAPTDKVVLSITGKVGLRNVPDGVAFDMAMLERLPQRSFQTRTPWFPEPRKFTGVLLRDLLAAVGAQAGQRVNAQAINDYRADIPAEDWTDFDLLLAYRLDDAPMGVRDRGPLLLIYPFDANAKLRTAVHYSRAVWQVKALDVR